MPEQIRTRLFRAVMILALLLSAQAGFAAIWLASLDGVCVDEHGKPLTGTVVHFTDPKNGKYFDVRTDSAGRFFYIAAQPSIYTLLIKRDRKPPIIFEDVDIQWSSQPLQLEVNLERNTVTVTRKTMLPEFFRQDETQVIAARRREMAIRPRSPPSTSNWLRQSNSPIKAIGKAQSERFGTRLKSIPIATSPGHYSARLITALRRTPRMEAKLSLSSASPAIKKPLPSLRPRPTTTISETRM